MNNNTYSETISDWLATKGDDVVFNPKKGFYPFSVIADAYKKGAVDAEKNLIEGMRSNLLDSGKKVANSLKNMVDSLIEKNFIPQRLFIKMNYNEQGYYLSFKEDVYLSDEFIDYTYSKISDMQADLFDEGINLKVGVLNDEKLSDLSQLQCDGYQIGIDYSTGDLIYK